MALETLSSKEHLNFIIYDTISATPFTCYDSSETTTTINPPCSFFCHLENQNPNPSLNQDFSDATAMDTIMTSNSSLTTTTDKMYMAVTSYCNEKIPKTNFFNNNNNCNNQNLGVQVGGSKKKRRRRPRVCKNKEEAETQRMIHIAVERNRRKQMNEHLAVLRSLMPESYAQRGDQASIVGGAIDFVKELEHLLHSLEAQKFIFTQQQTQQEQKEDGQKSNFTKLSSNNAPPFAQFFSYPQYTCSQIPNKYTSKSKAGIADIEVTLIEKHANLRVLLHKHFTQLSKMVACFQTLHMSVLHLNVTTLEPLVLYSISLKIEEGCRLNSADEIAGAVHQMLGIIEEEATLCVVDSVNYKLIRTS
ncbi:transcription factor bHLH71-like [Rutidosis leptorrhynchoides]|uniref:transcription factor bHLH71-like n=1 Tax=Rutidosis leptorrhynchoides TaxID=125765 RepID=UPI003A9A3956